MRYFYSFLIRLVALFLPLVALFFSKKSKIRFFVNGRKNVWNQIAPLAGHKVIWVHCASLGEFEQGRSLIESLKKRYSKNKILITFFSPSGYQVQKNYPLADVVTYLPMDTPAFAKKFLKITKPHLAIFVKYEFWINYLYFLHKANVPTILIAAIFRKNQFVFTPYGMWIQRYLKNFSHCFVQNESSKKLLQSIGYNEITICGDTRFDRVALILKQQKKIPFLEQFKDSKTLLVCGSTWHTDELYLRSYINTFLKSSQKILIAPHNIHRSKIQKLQKSINKKSLLFSEIKNQNLKNYSVLILDTVGLLSRAYGYADIAYVGGGYTSDGIHNILEPATYGIPIVIGKNYQKFQEAVALCNLKGCTVTRNAQELSIELKNLFDDPKKRKTQGKICRDYVVQNLGATDIILKYIEQNCLSLDL